MCAARFRFRSKSSRVNEMTSRSSRVKRFERGLYVTLGQDRPRPRLAKLKAFKRDSQHAARPLRRKGSGVVRLALHANTPSAKNPRPRKVVVAGRRGGRMARTVAKKGAVASRGDPGPPFPLPGAPAGSPCRGPLPGAPAGSRPCRGPPVHVDGQRQSRRERRARGSAAGRRDRRSVGRRARGRARRHDRRRGLIGRVHAGRGQQRRRSRHGGLSASADCPARRHKQRQGLGQQAIACRTSLQLAPTLARVLAARGVQGERGLAGARAACRVRGRVSRLDGSPCTWCRFCHRAGPESMGASLVARRAPQSSTSTYVRVCQKGNCCTCSHCVRCCVCACCCRRDKMTQNPMTCAALATAAAPSARPARPEEHAPPAGGPAPLP